MTDPGEDDAAGIEEFINSVVSYLGKAKEPVAVASQHSNEIQENKETIQAFAKIAGNGWTYYVKTMSVNIGRPPEENQTPDAASQASESSNVHLDLGPSKMISRLHAEIFFSGEDRAGAGGWRILVNGRNGLRINTSLYKRGQSASLRCGDVIDINGTQMMFVTPRDKVEVFPSILEAVRLAASGEIAANTEADYPHAHPQTPSSFGNAQFVNQTESLPIEAAAGTNGVPLAPMPPNHSRVVTPNGKVTNGGMLNGVADPSKKILISSNGEIDYSLEANAHLKSPWSYALLIAQAILSSDEKMITLAQIYDWIKTNFSWFRHQDPAGWQVSTFHSKL